MGRTWSMRGRPAHCAAQRFRASAPVAAIEPFESFDARSFQRPCTMLCTDGRVSRIFCAELAEAAFRAAELQSMGEVLQGVVTATDFLSPLANVASGLLSARTQRRANALHGARICFPA